MPLTCTFSRPVISGWKPTPTEISGATRPAHGDGAGGRAGHAREQPEQRGLAGAVAPEHADGLAGLDAGRDVAERPGVGAGGAGERQQRTEQQRLLGQALVALAGAVELDRGTAARRAHSRSTKRRSRRRWASRPAASSTTVATTLDDERAGQGLVAADRGVEQRHDPGQRVDVDPALERPEQRLRVEDRRDVDPHEQGGLHEEPHVAEGHVQRAQHEGRARR